MIKDLIYTTLGAGVLAKEKIQKELDELKTKGEGSKEKVKQMQKELEAKGKEEETKLRAQIKEIVKEVVDEMGLVTKEDIKK
ncbi:MAG: hypothetical protein ACN2B6_12185 [Rickettsiales bacterium]